ncbi:uncharacterized protein F5891DRAFT_1190035 [Suillus fuscotomentosus]|uniref:Uncharacterized protein n=1 Tax=Suillus fuscotomentosus TaxID=1912939 RepID=A0AAD4HK88_9AGAM|nr:uncharacterized protein F5891DRAFT_1190035 [Suillus fuscotomentosus]KAG1899231.1 hypothetical protein F5891DRAFT_1190035 [Suillus fuscotomentosus]
MESWSNLKRAQAPASSNDDEPNSKRMRSEKSRVAPSPLEDEGAWRILFQYLTTQMTYPQMEEEFSSYLGDRYCADDWKDARAALFSADDLNDDATPLANLRALYAKHVVPRSSSPSDIVSSLEDSSLVAIATRVTGHLSAHTHKSRHRSRQRVRNPYIDAEAEEDSTEEEEEEEEEEVDSNCLARPPPVGTSFSGPSAKQTFFSAIDNIFDKVKTSKLSDIRVPYRAAWSPGTIQNRMYLLHVHRTATVFITEHLRKKGLAVTISSWIPGQLYVVADSPKTISSLLPDAHRYSIRDYLCISDEEREAVERARAKLPNPGWVRITHGKYKGDIGYVYDSEQLNDFVVVLIPSRDLPYPTISDIVRDGEVIGCSYKGEQYYMGLLLKNFHRHGLEIVTTPHPDYIWLHLQSRWDTRFIKTAELAFSMQFLHVGDEARVVTGEIHSEIGKVVSTNHAFGSVCLELLVEGCQR